MGDLTLPNDNILYGRFNSFPNDNILYGTKFNAFGDDKVNVVEKLNFVLGRVGNIVEQELRKAAHIRPKGLVSVS